MLLSYESGRAVRGRPSVSTAVYIHTSYITFASHTSPAFRIRIHRVRTFHVPSTCLAYTPTPTPALRRSDVDQDNMIPPGRVQQKERRAPIPEVGRDPRLEGCRLRGREGNRRFRRDGHQLLRLRRCLNGLQPALDGEQWAICSGCVVYRRTKQETKAEFHEVQKNTPAVI